MTSFDVFEDAPGASVPVPRSGRCTRLIAVLSSAAGLVLIANAAHPGVLRTLSTLELLGIVVLAVFPVLTLLALRLEHRFARGVSRAMPATRGWSQTRITTHDAHDRHPRNRTRVAFDHAPTSVAAERGHETSP